MDNNINYLPNICSPENRKSKKRSILIKLFCGYTLLKEAAECKDYTLVSSAEEMTRHMEETITFTNEKDQLVYAKEVRYLTSQYAQTLTKEDYDNYIAVMADVSEDFERAYQIIAEFIRGNCSRN